jgi:S-DNA-T family DNA segregation ATPase FtsK/SpoIIIE
MREWAVAKRKQTRRTKRRISISLDSWVGAAGILFIAVAALTVLALLSFSRGSLTAGWIRLLRSGFGWAAYVLPLGLGALGYWLFTIGFGHPIHVPPETFVGALLLFLGGLGLLHHFSADPQAVALSGGGGGQVGWLISRGLISALGDLGALLVLLAVMVVGLISLLSISVSDAVALLSAAWQRLQNWYRLRSIETGNAYAPPPDQSLPARVMAKVQEQTEPARRVTPTPRTDERGLLFPRVVGVAREWQLPALEDILEEGAEQELSQAEIRAKVRIIEETLKNFGVPAKVVEVNQGPTITQFGLEPGFVERKMRDGRVRRVKVKVNRISALANDLALALAASPIRIEAPVPGRSLVGIEVPNVSVSLVSLASVMQSDSFRNINSKLRLALGQDVAGQAVAADLALMPHLLIAGATGSGKSVCINSITSCLLLNNTPEDMRLIMVDPKMVELTIFNGIPHLLVPVVVEIERVVATLKWLTQEMDRRYRLFSNVGARHIDMYNEMCMSRGEEKLPYIVVLIDELADLMMVAPDEAERYICRIAQLARATGIHLVLATQRPSVDVVTGLIKANFPARISFAVTSQVDSRVILDTLGAEKLLGRGDMLYMASDSSKLVRLQGCFVSDAELQRLVDYWRGFRTSPPLPPGAALVQQPLWEEARAREMEAASKDDLLEEAIAMVREQQRASTTLLQRRLRIGYSRAARLLDAMEEMGIIGPPEGASRGRQVIKGDQQGPARDESQESS